MSLGMLSREREMKFATVKKDSEIQLPGVEVFVERRDNSINSLTLVSGGRLLKVVPSYGSIEVLAPAPPKLVKKFNLAGRFAGLTPVSELFTHKHEAESRLREFAAKFTGPDEDLGLTITEVEVPEEE